jgi:lactase-phlorizin hydrolase
VNLLNRRFTCEQFEFFLHPIFSEKGDFPDIVKKIVAENSKQEGRRRSRLPQFTDEEIQSLKGTMCAVILYSTKCVRNSGF